MRRLVSLLFLFFALTGSFATSAQDVLDRVEPTRLEERTADKAEIDAEVTAGPRAANADLAPNGKAVFVGAIEIVGLTALKNSDFSDIVQRFIGRPLDRSQIAALTDILATRARKQFPLATVRVEPQDVVGGVLVIQLDEGRVDAVELVGFENRSLEKLYSTLVTGQSVTVQNLETALLLAQDVEGVSIRETSIRREGNRNTLVVRGSYARFRGQMTLDNDTIEPIGPFEVFGFAQANGVFSHDDSIQAYILTALPQPRELGFARVRYTTRLDNAGTDLTASGSFSKSMPGSYLAPLDIVSESWWASIGLSRPLVRSVRRSLWLDGSLSRRELHQDREGNPSRKDRLTVARVRLSGSAKLAGGVLQSGGTFSQGLDMFGATRSGDALASRPDADGTFTSLVLSANWTRQVAGAIGARASVRSQLASSPLLVSEEIGLGGGSFARGYDYSERSGDQGAMGYFELNYSLKPKSAVINGIKLYVFVDGGSVINFKGGSGSGSLYSLGGGVRLDINRRLDAAIELAQPVSGNRYEKDSKSPRLRMSLTRYF